MEKYDNSNQEPLPANENNEKSGSEEVRQCDDVEINNDDNPLWDGSESEFVEDDDAAVFEEKYTGIKLNYELKISEIYTCLKNFSDYKRNTKKVVVETILLSIVCVGFLLSGIFRNSVNGYIFSGISLLLIAIVWIIPYLIIRNHAKELAKSGEIYAEIYPDEIVLGYNGLEKNIKLNENCKFAIIDNLYVIIPPRENMIIIPIRSIEPDFLPDVEAMIMAGTSPVSAVDF